MKPLKLALVQFQPKFRDIDGNLNRISELTNALQADIIVLPELSTTGYFFLSREESAEMAEQANGRTGQFFRDMAQRHEAIVIAGFAEKQGNRIYNSCLTVVPEQNEPYLYRKTHLFYKERDCFDAGDGHFFVVEDAKRNVRIGPMICYDWRFPEVSRILALKGADLIVCPSDLVTDLWRRAMPGRAVENKVYAAVANRTGTEERNGEELTFTGRSAVYGFNGEELACAGPDEDAVVTAQIVPADTRDKSFNAFNDIFGDRKPECYRPLTGE
ncbi:MAG: carbon-nitrogen hydrolase [Deltaproteobacteria bacterium SG8_13]|nr:MAG: carbon-nitrogen hydrolase [Deltaproteobacteria bacterium SG8_13]